MLGLFFMADNIAQNALYALVQFLFMDGHFVTGGVSLLRLRVIKPEAQSQQTAYHGQETIMLTSKTGLAIATAAAAMFAMGAVPAAQAADDGSVMCQGVNSCKGTADCKTAKNDCKGQNSCKGQGWVKKSSAEECTKAGGTVVKG